MFDKLSRTIETETKAYLDFLCKLCSFEAQAQDKQTLDQMADHICCFAGREGFEVTRTAMETCGDFLCIDLNPGAPKACVFMAHADTVHAKGAFGKEPVTRLDDRIIAPGTIDCKGGIVIALLAMKALRVCGYTKHVRLLVTTDEEISNILGGEAEQRFFVEKTAGFPCAVNCETAENDEVVVSRKGICKYQIDIAGTAGHSGIHYFDCKNAIEEAAHKILALHAKSRRGGITYSCNIIHGGVRENIIPEACSVRVDIRYPRRQDLAEIERTLEEIVGTSFIGGTTATGTRISLRPPMEKDADTMALFDKLLAACKRHGLGSLTPIESGGGSDSCYTQAAGIPSICGMGGCGEFCHTNREYILTASVPLRAKILTAFLTDEE